MVIELSKYMLMRSNISELVIYVYAMPFVCVCVCVCVHYMRNSFSDKLFLLESLDQSEYSGLT